MTKYKSDRSKRRLLSGDAGAQFDVRDRQGQPCGLEQIGAVWAISSVEHAKATETGNLGVIDKCGQVFSLGRQANAIGTAFGWLTPREGEELLESHPAVAAAALVAIDRDTLDALGYQVATDVAADGDIGAAFIAVVELLAGSAPSSPVIELELLEFCAQKLSAAKCPIGLVFSDSLPRALLELDDESALAALKAVIVAAHEEP